MAETPETDPAPDIRPASAIDPNLVPKYPVYQLHYKDQADPEQPHPEQAGPGQPEAEQTDPGQVRDTVIELDGIRVEPALGQSPAEAAVAAIARKATEQDRKAVRVVVTTGASDTHQPGGPNQARGKWFSIVTRDGEVIEAPDHGSRNSGHPPPGKASRRTPRVKKILLIGGAVLLPLTVAGAAATIAVNANPGEDTEPAAASQWEIPNAGAQIPVGLPTGYAPTADWVIAVDDQSAPVAIDTDALESATIEDDTLGIIDADGHLVAVDAETAQPVWHSTQAPSDIEALHPSTWAGHDVLIEATNQQLMIWPIPQEPTEEPVAPTAVELSHQAEVSFAGEAPLIYLGDYVALAEGGDGTLTEVEIPAGAEPLLATDTDVVSIDADHIYRTPISPDGEDAASDGLELSHHSAAQNSRAQNSRTESPRVENVWALGESTVAATYIGADEQSLLQVFDLSTGDRISAKHLEDAPGENDQALVDEQAQTAMIGSTAIHWGDHPDGEDPIIELDETLRDPLLAGTTLWGTTNEGPAQLDVITEDAEVEHYEVLGDEDPAPVLVTDEAAYLAAPRVDDTLLYRAKHNHTEDSAETQPLGESVPDETEEGE